ncbi:hypothetical protein FS837_013040 [Tulasnella sp. UAMH 9824]|nr:hypothetical protein FS837_013040 [Tulasnella sp. UAMH 9824]
MEKLPVEILTTILLLSMDSRQRHSRRRLSLVCPIWSSIISQHPLFWTEVGLHRTAKEFREVLQRNKAGPLDVSWTPHHPQKPVGEVAENLMELISSESRRWRSLTLKGYVSDRIQNQLIQVPNPQLININICDLRNASGMVLDFPLNPEGLPLRNVVLGGAALDWDCSRLKGLRSLRVQGLRENQPTLLQLHKIISSSPELEVAILASWNWEFPGSADAPPNLDAIRLQYLNPLILDSINPNVVGGISSLIAAPNCQNLRIDWARANVVQDQYAASRLADLLHGLSKGASALFLTYNPIYRDISLADENDRGDEGSTNILEATSKLAKRRGLYFHFRVPNAAEDNVPQPQEESLGILIRNVFRPALSGLNIPVQFHLWTESEDGPGELAPDVLFDFDFITSLKLSSYPGFISTIDYLASPQPCPGEDDHIRPGSWPCPYLEKITVLCKKGNFQGLRDALDRLRRNRAQCLVEGGAVGPRGPHLEDQRPRPIKEIIIKNYKGAVFQTWSEEGWILWEVD